MQCSINRGRERRHRRRRDTDMVSVEGMVGGCRTSGGTWTEQARIVSMLAGELDIVVDEQALMLYDVRDLLALRRRLAQELQAPRQRRRAGGRRDARGQRRVDRMAALL